MPAVNHMQLPQTDVQAGLQKTYAFATQYHGQGTETLQTGRITFFQTLYTKNKIFKNFKAKYRCANH